GAQGEEGSVLGARVSKRWARLWSSAHRRAGDDLACARGGMAASRGIAPAPLSAGRSALLVRTESVEQIVAPLAGPVDLIDALVPHDGKDECVERCLESEDRGEGRRVHAHDEGVQSDLA